MSVIFCSECGKKHEYSFSKPNFCSGCGSSLGASMAAKKPQKKILAARSRQEEIDEDDYDEDSSDSEGIPMIDEIQVDIESIESVNVFSLGSIFGQPQTQVRKSNRRPTSLEDFKNNRK
jgi:hypothetical protein